MSSTHNAKRKAQSFEINDTQAPNAKRAKANSSRIVHRPWLVRKQNIKEQDVWLIHCRDNLVPGATGPTDTKTMTDEFNEHFKDALKAPLAPKTLLKRITKARKQYNIDNPEYAAAVQYLVPNLNGGNDIDDSFGEQEESDVDKPEQAAAPKSTPAIDEEAATRSASDAQLKRPNKLLHVSGSTRTDYSEGLLGTSNGHPGAHTSCLDYQISSIDRVKHHLRRRTDHPVAFIFQDDEKHESVEDDEQFIDGDTLTDISPWYARRSRAIKTPDCPVDVSEDFNTRTINAFIQIVSPVRAKTLPTHYLWDSKKPVGGVHDRFGDVRCEKIHWGVDNLHKLHGLARFMEVTWICDMVIDRLHWMYEGQAMLRKASGIMQTREGWITIDGEEKIIGRRLPTVSDLEYCSLSSDDFETEWLSQLAAEPADLPALTFIADVMHALGGVPDPTWLQKAPKLARNVFAQAGSYDCLTEASRVDFCAQYHHHGEDELCYTVTPEYTAQHFADQLYTASSTDETVTFSHAWAAMNSRSIKYGTMEKLKEANSTPEMLDAEKMVLEMKIRLEETEAAIRRAHAAGPEEKDVSVRVAKKMSQSMYKPVDDTQK
jgi:hypothetical protein